jgi:cytochrome c551/c552
VIWAALSTITLAVLGGVLAWQAKLIGRRPTSYIQPDPTAGRMIFVEKGCASCHDALHRSDHPPAVTKNSSLPKLVTAMWNHAPKMWEAIEDRNIPYPEMSYEETGQLIAYLYFSQYVDGFGDPERGRQIFQEKQCVNCHFVGATLQASGKNSKRGIGLIDNPITWTQIMWNHGAQMRAAMQAKRVQWPKFTANDLRDLLAYVQHQSGQQPEGRVSFPATNPDQGWKVFQQKGCINCHSLKENSGGRGPALGVGSKVPASFAQFGALMLNHFPEMQEVMHKTGEPLPTFEEREMSDLVGFIYSLHYSEPSGSAPVGESVFSWRGCGGCHGERAQGTYQAPQLRGRGQVYTTTRLATDLWEHGAKMYQRNRRVNREWPVLQESDIGDLVTFLNSPLTD